MSIFRDGLFEGKVALVTGGGTGIGRGITEGLAALGASTAILSRKAEHIGPTASAVAAHTGRECLPVVADVRQPDQVEAAVARVVEEFGRLDYPGERRGRQLSVPLGRPLAQRVRHRARHRRQGDVERHPRRVSCRARQARRLDPEHQRHAPLRRDARPAPRRRGQGRGRRLDANPGRRMGPAGHPRQRDRTRPDRRHRRRPAALPRRGGRAVRRPSSPRAGSARSTTS